MMSAVLYTGRSLHASRFKIFDSDTHLNPMAESLEPYFDPAMRQRLPEWERSKVPFRVG